MTAIFYKDDGQNLPLLGTPIVRWVETADLGGRISRGNKGTLTHIHTYKHTHTHTHSLSITHTPPPPPPPTTTVELFYLRQGLLLQRKLTNRRTP